VREAFQGEGVGTLLLKGILVRATKLGYHTVVAGIVPPNEASVRLHERLGFGYVGNFREVGFKFARWQDVAFYQVFLPVKAARARKGARRPPKIGCGRRSRHWALTRKAMVVC